MRTEKEIYDLVLNFAFQDERIRIVTLEGSRTNVNIPKDNLQDYDITFFVIDMSFNFFNAFTNLSYVSLVTISVFPLA